MSVIDTNILIDYLKGDPRAAEAVAADEHPVMSVISLAELLVGARSPEAELAVRGLTKKLKPIPIDDEVATVAAMIRRGDGLKLPDALILATAKTLGTKLITRDTKDFGPNSALVHVPYKI